MTANMTHLKASFEEVENDLLNIEDLREQCELERSNIFPTTEQITRKIRGRHFKPSALN